MGLWDSIKGGAEQVVPKVDWDIRRSAMATGAGTPWAAGNTNKPEDYAVAGSALPLAASDPTGITGSNWALTTGPGFDLEGEERTQKGKAQGTQAVADYNKQAQQDLIAGQQRDEANRAAAWEQGKQSQTEAAGKLENAYNKAYTGRKMFQGV